MPSFSSLTCSRSLRLLGKGWNRLSSQNFRKSFWKTCFSLENIMKATSIIILEWVGKPDWRRKFGAIHCTLLIGSDEPLLPVFEQFTQWRIIGRSSPINAWCIHEYGIPIDLQGPGVRRRIFWTMQEACHGGAEWGRRRSPKTRGFKNFPRN